MLGPWGPRGGLQGRNDCNKHLIVLNYTLCACIYICIKLDTGVKSVTDNKRFEVREDIRLCRRQEGSVARKYSEGKSTLKSKEKREGKKTVHYRSLFEKSKKKINSSFSRNSFRTITLTSFSATVSHRRQKAYF